MKPAPMTLLTLTILLVGACGGSEVDPIGCTAEARSGIGVVLTDGATGMPIEGATLTLREAEHEETLWEIGPGEYTGAFERPGLYSLTIEADGYEGALREDILITSDVCHVHPVGLDVQLMPR